MLVINRHEVAASYAKGWMTVDVLSCLPISYVTMVTSNGGEADSKGKSVRHTI